MQKLILTKATCEAHDLDFILIALQLSESFRNQTTYNKLCVLKEVFRFSVTPLCKP